MHAMNISARFLRVYFDCVYNRIYDVTTAKLGRYRKLQEKCISNLDFKDNDYVLCAGIGTGNEISHIWRKNKLVNIVGVDYSKKALQKARQKALQFGQNLEVYERDVQNLPFPAETFDKVVCIHVTDFVQDKRMITKELIRVLKVGGEFVITYPSAVEGFKLGMKILLDGMTETDSRSRSRIRAGLRLAINLFLGTAYLPINLRPGKNSYSLAKLRQELTSLGISHFHIEEHTPYDDFLVWGTK